MNTKPLATALLAAVALTFSAAAAAETYTFDYQDFVLDGWENPFSGDSVFGFRVSASGNPQPVFWPTPPAPVDGTVGITAFGAANDSLTDTTIVLGFTATPNTTYTIDWSNSWLEDAGGAQISLAGITLTQADAALAANPWGGGGLDAGAAWYFDLPVSVFDITGGSIAYTVTSVPEPETWAMLLAGLGVMGATARRRVR
ncbi:MAG: PEPxxWA-CTERM sorting domain-containing protein [Azoarcus sp.]|nr:PEPxxWA-CTERM sorting domain-containing protein [Azoarcus sp.]